MEKSAKIAAYFEKEGPFREGIAVLRDLISATELEEDFKWSSPIYTLGKEHVAGILAFKNHFGIWFFNGVFLSDPLGVLENAREGKTKALRHWKFTSVDQIDTSRVRSYVQEAIDIARKGIKLKPSEPKKTTLPDMLQAALKTDPVLKNSFGELAPYKQRDYAEYIATAKQEATKKRRLAKILPMIGQGIGLNDKYRNC